jgi:hypothetical protein
LFYKKGYKTKNDLFFHNNNLFFFDINFNKKNEMNFFNVNVFPVKSCFDYSSLKQNELLYVSKPKFMSFKIFSENQISNFEKFYLKNNIFIVDNFEHGMINDENIDFFTNVNFEKERIEDYKHFFFTRLPLPPVYGRLKKDIEEEAKKEAINNMNTDPEFISNFDVTSSFYRKSKFEYNGVNKYFFKGLLLDKKIFYNTISFRKYNLKNFFLYNFIFGYSRDASS